MSSKRKMFVIDRLAKGEQPIYDMSATELAVTLIDGEPKLHKSADRIVLQLYAGGITDEQINSCLNFAKVNNLRHNGKEPEHFGALVINHEGAEGLFFFVKPTDKE